jgi:type II secretory pathway component PulF
MVRAGEKAGMLGKALGNVVEDLTFHRNVKMRFTYTCVYLLGLLIGGLLIVSVVVTFVFPRFAEFWDEAGQPLPWPTTLFVDPSGLGGVASLTFGAWILPVLVLASFLLSRYLLGMPAGLATVIPGLRGAFLRHQTGRYLAALGMYLEARAPTDRAVSAAAEVTRLSRIRKGRDEVAARVREGVPVGDALGSMKTLREDLLWRIRAAERRGDLTKTLLALGSEEQEAAHRRFLYFLGWFRPISIVIIGGLELLVVLAGYLPLFDMVNLIPAEFL